MSTLLEKSLRRYDLDVLKIFATLLLIPYHAARIFDGYNFYVHNDINSPELELFTRFIDMWFMPIFFFIAGASAKYSLDFKNEKQYIFEQFKRLFIPFIFGIFFLIPPIGYFAFLSHHENVNLSYYQYYPYFFKLDFERIDGFTGTFTPAHLWFIFYLFCFCLITLPFFYSLKASKGKQFISKLADYLSQKPKAIFLCVVPLTLARIIGLVYFNFVYYLLFFILGYLFLLDQRFERSVEENNSIALSLSLLGMLFYLYTRVGEFRLFYGGISFINILIQLLLSLNTLCWLIVILNFACKYLNWHNSLIAYLNQASYPIYILHTTFVIAVGFYVVQWDMGVISKFIWVTLISSIGMFLVYNILIKRFNMVRFLFGMKLKI